MAKKNLWKKLLMALAIVILICGLAVILFSGDNYAVVQALFNGDTDGFMDGIQSLGARGVIVFGLLSMLQVILTFLPAEPVQVLAGISYGFWNGFLICLAGVFVGNTIIFLLYKVFGDKLDNYFHKNIEVDFDILRESKRIVLLIFILYFLPAIPYGLICFFAATVNKNYFRYITVTVLGACPSIMIGVGLGHIAITSSWILSLCLFGVLVILIVLLYAFRDKVFKKVNEFAVKQFGYSSKTKVQKPNALLHGMVWLGMKIWLGLNIKQKTDKQVDKVEGPAIILCNHGSFIDFVYLSLVLKNEKPRVVSGRQYFYGRRLGQFLKKMGCIPKSMFTTDIESTRNCMQIIKEKGVLVIFPEARLSTAGEFEDIQPGTAKFLQRMNANVYVIKFGGDYLAMPKWAKRKGKARLHKKALVEATFTQLYKQGEPMQVSTEEFEKTIFDALDYNEFDWLAAHPEIKYDTKHIAEGLDNILYRCPTCGKEFTLEAKGNAITCTHCGTTGVMTDRYAFENGRPFENFQQWYRWQKEQMREQMDADENFCLQDEVTLYHESPSGRKQLIKAGNGVCKLDASGLTYEGTDGEETITKHFPQSVIYRLLFGAGEDFEIYEGDHFWYFVPPDKRSCVKWYLASILFEEKHSNK